MLDDAKAHVLVFNQGLEGPLLGGVPGRPGIGGDHGLVEQGVETDEVDENYHQAEEPPEECEKSGRHGLEKNEKKIKCLKIKFGGA